jgi:Ser/Thr protein kinase RdoA (MazF antagonist)
MKPYGKLTRLGQLRRMRQLAEVALDAYGLVGARLTFLRYFANCTYRVDVAGQVSQGSESDRFMPNRYLLRILLAGDWEYAKGEMTWLSALGREAGLHVPEPVLTLKGELLTRIATPGMPKGRIVSLMRWVDGRQLSRGLQLRYFRPWGEMVGRLHAFAAGWTPPARFRRFVWDWEGLLGGRGFGYTVEDLVDSMPERLREPFQIVSQATRAAMKELGRGPDAYGMVHGDMYPDNILFKNGEVFPIDFEDCGFGYWLWDTGVALSQQPWTETWYRQREAFLDGYARFHPLPESQLEYLDLFVAANYATGVLWASAFLRDDPARQAEHEAWRDENGALLLRYCECF